MAALRRSGDPPPLESIFTPTCACGWPAALSATAATTSRPHSHDFEDGVTGRPLRVIRASNRVTELLVDSA
jgi:hypothetical protein